MRKLFIVGAACLTALSAIAQTGPEIDAVKLVQGDANPDWYMLEDSPEVTVGTTISINGKTYDLTQGQVDSYLGIAPLIVSDGADMTYEAAQAEVNTKLSKWSQKTYPLEITLNRTIYKDGCYNTLCLPFDLTAAQIAETFGETPKELKEFISAYETVENGVRKIILEIQDAETIEAGKAYLISFNSGDNLTELTFRDVNVSQLVADEQSGDLVFQGILAPYQLPYGNENYLFIGSNNSLYWANNDGSFMKGFRAYFQVSTQSNSPYRRGMAAAFGSGRTVATDANNLSSDMQEINKLIEQDRVVILNKGVRYDMNGNMIK